MGALADILKGERGLFGLLLVIAATVFVGLGQVTFQQWQDYTTWIFSIFVGGKTVTTSVGLMTHAKNTAADAPKEP